MSYEGKKVLVVGMAKSGISAAKLLKKLAGPRPQSMTAGRRRISLKTGQS